MAREGMIGTYCRRWTGLKSVAVVGILGVGTMFGTTACTPTGAAVGAGATVGVAAMQERSMGQAVTDKTIQVGINARMLDKSFDDLLAAVSVDVVEGRVLLTGNVPTDELRDEATRLAWQSEDVLAVINELEVREGAGLVNNARDTWISSQLRGKIVADKEILGVNYAITTNNGAVYLMGINQSQDEVARVIQHARSIPNVRRVVDHTVFKDDPSRQ